MPTDVKQVPTIMVGNNYYRKFLPDLSKRLRPINALFRKSVKFAFTPAMEKLVREILAELMSPTVLAFPDCDAVADGTRPFHVYCEVCIDGFGATLEREHANGSMKTHRVHQPSYARLGTALYFSRFGGWQHRLGSQAPPRLPLSTRFRIFSDHKVWESRRKVGNQFRDGSSFSPHSITPSNTE